MGHIGRGMAHVDEQWLWGDQISTIHTPQIASKLIFQHFCNIDFIRATKFDIIKTTSPRITQTSHNLHCLQHVMHDKYKS